MFELPNEKIIKPPVTGWKKRTYYEVRVSYADTNPIHKAIFFTGFLNNGEPGNYNTLWSGAYGGSRYEIKDAYYLEAIRDLNIDEEDKWETQKWKSLG